MVTAHGVVGSDFCSLTGDSNHNHVTSSSSNLKLSWAGDFQSLKDFVNTVLKVEGEWSSPGREKKLFTSNKVILMWLRN